MYLARNSLLIEFVAIKLLDCLSCCCLVSVIPLFDATEYSDTMWLAKRRSEVSLCLSKIK